MDLGRYFAMRKKIGAERGWPPASREQFEGEAGPGGALFVGSPETVAQKIAETARVPRPANPGSPGFPRT